MPKKGVYPARNRKIVILCVSMVVSYKRADATAFYCLFLVVETLIEVYEAAK